MKTKKNYIKGGSNMAKTSGASCSSTSSKKIRPALSPEARENQCISLAVNLAEKQLREGTASSQVIVHYLKQSTAKAQLELERMRYENEMIQAKTENLKAIKNQEELLDKALKAFRGYSGQGDPDEDDY